MSKKWQPHAKHIVDQGVYIDEILACDPFNNKMLFDALLYNLQTLAEATQHLPDALKQQYPDIPWRRIAGFRNIVVHEYLGDRRFPKRSATPPCSIHQNHSTPRYRSSVIRTQYRVHPGLTAEALLLKPRQHFGVKAKGFCNFSFGE